MQAPPSLQPSSLVNVTTALHRRLRTWYHKYGRHDLPWRRTEDAYAIWVSEVMLQQTQVETVLARFYHPFLKRFPTIKTLATADEVEVLKVWQGLGYYSRARNLHKAAKITAPSLPRTVEGLMALPGIGRNTAHAIAAFAYHTPVPVMEANVRRVLHRFHAQPSMTEEECWQAAEALLDKKHPFDYNQAMMDVGAMVCTPKAPNCPACPLAPECSGKAAPLTYPAPKAIKRVPVRRVVILVPYTPKKEFHFTSRTGNFLGGLYQFPEFPVDQPLPKTWNGTKLQDKKLIPLGTVRHTYSHFRVEAEVFLSPIPNARGKGWVKSQALAGLPHSKVEEKILQLLIKQGYLAG